MLSRRDLKIAWLACGMASAPYVAVGQAPAVSAWATGGTSATALPTDPDGKPAAAAGTAAGLPPYWQATAVPAAVVQGGAIPPGWQPQAIAYQGIGPDGRVLTTYVAPTYVFTYQSGPPVLAIPQVNRRQSPGGQTPPPVGASAAMLPATTAGYAPQPYQFPADSRAMSGTAIVPPSEPLPAKSAPAASPWVPSQPRPPAVPAAPAMMPAAALPPAPPPMAAPAAMLQQPPAIPGPPSAWGPVAPVRVLGSSGNTAASTVPGGVPPIPTAGATP